MNLNNMGLTIADLNKGERGVITDCSSKGSPEVIRNGMFTWK